VLAPTRTAREQAETERAEVAAERRAIEAFIDRVESLSTASRARAGTRSPGMGTVAVETDASDATLATIRSAYRETVMAVDHYETVYGDGLPESLAAEFGPELAVAIGDGAGGAFTPQLRGALLDAAGESRDDRTRFLDTLDAEIESLRAAENAFGELFGRLGDQPEGAPAAPAPGDGIVDRLETIAAGRQERLNRRPDVRRVDGHDLCSYLYADAGWTYPVLAGVARFRAGLGADP
jgi:hypothetical protein